MMNPFQVIGMMKNPQAFLQQITNNSQIMQNPIAQNVIRMLQDGDTKGLQAMAENLAREKGTDINTVNNNLRQYFGMK